jgi:hypothetical protein
MCHRILFMGMVFRWLIINWFLKIQPIREEIQKFYFLIDWIFENQILVINWSNNRLMQLCTWNFKGKVFMQMISLGFSRDSQTVYSLTKSRDSQTTKRCKFLWGNPNNDCRHLIQENCGIKRKIQENCGKTEGNHANFLYFRFEFFRTMDAIIVICFLIWII